MNTRLIIKNATALGISGFVAKAITAVVGIVVTRYLGPASYGDYTAANAYVGIFILFAELGISQYMVQEGSRNLAVLPRYFGSTLLVKTALCVLCYLLMLALMFPAGYSSTVKTLIVVAGLGVCFNALNQSVYNYYQAVQKLYLAAWFQFLTTFLIAIFTVIVIMAGMGVVEITFTHLLTYAIISGLLYLALRKEVKPEFQIRGLSTTIKNALPFGIHRIFYYMFAQLSLLILSLLTTNFELGIYSAAYKLVLILIFIPSLMTSAVYPVLYQLGESDTAKHRDVIEKMFKVLAAVGIAGSTLIFVLAEPLTIWIYAGRFNDSAPILMIVAWLLAFECMSFALGDILTTTNRQWQRTVIQGSALLILFLLIVVLFPGYGIYGAAYAVILVEAFIFLCYYIIVRKKVYKIRLLRQLPATGIAAVVMGLCAWALQSYHPVLAAAAAGSVFLVLIAILDKDFRKIGRYAVAQVLQMLHLKR
ncbi:MAG: flippase [Peptococcaceae bacterium]|jgi:O-antigen/teichoic acid export membrane protein|nr:flippase [Peptococcaceae bacterium]